MSIFSSWRLRFSRFVSSFFVSPVFCGLSYVINNGKDKNPPSVTIAMYTAIEAHDPTTPNILILENSFPRFGTSTLSIVKRIAEPARDKISSGLYYRFVIPFVTKHSQVSQFYF